MMRTTSSTWMVACALAGACVSCASDPSVAVVITQDTALPVTSTTVSVYASATLTCDQVEFGAITDDQLEGLLITSTTVGGPALENLPRLGTKIIVARGYGATGTWMTAGCAEVDDVDSGTATAAIAMVAVATVTVGAANDNTSGLLITTTDALDNSIDGREVRWVVFGAAGTTADPTHFTTIENGEWAPMAPTCTASGEVNIHPMPPRLPGGFAVQVSVGWAAPQLALLSAFTPVDRADVTVGSDTTGVVDALIISRCALKRTAGAVSVVCLNDDMNASEYAYASGAWVAGASTAFTLSGAQIATALISVPAATAGDLDVYAITDKGAWSPWANAPAPGNGMWCTALPCVPLTEPSARQVAVVPACGGDPAVLLGRFKDAPFLRAQAMHGSESVAITNLPASPTTINGAGCISELQANGSMMPRQTVVITEPATATTPTLAIAVFPCSATGSGSGSGCAVGLPAVGGVGFTTGTTGSGSANESRLVGSSFDATGALILSWVAEPAIDGSGAATTDRLVERTRQAAAAPPQAIVTGQFDSDGVADLLWDFSTKTSADVQIAYAQDADGAPLSALEPIPAATGDNAPTVLQVFSADVDGNGYDDVIIVTQTVDTVTVSAVATTTTTTTLSVVPLGNAYTRQPTYTPDPACPM